MPNPLRYLSLILIALTLIGCGGRPFNIVKPTQVEPTAKEAVVVFMRPRRGGDMVPFGGDRHALIYMDDQYQGELPIKAQMAVKAKPGKHIFMLSGFNADFLEANLKAGKKYFVVVEPVPMGIDKGFKFRPQNGQIEQDKLAAWHKAMHRLEPNERGHELAKKDEQRRLKLKQKYFEKWQQDRNHAALKASSGY